MRAADAGLMVCHECHQLNRATPGIEHQHCSRCGARVHMRRPNSIARTWALLITAALLYLPANLLPIMTVRMLGNRTPDTIMSGVVTLAKHGMFPIAAVVFIASILVPTFAGRDRHVADFGTKASPDVAATAHSGVPIHRMDRALVHARYLRHRHSGGDRQFGSLASVEAGFGAVAFASVVILTMLAAITFDPRLIWDNTEAGNKHD